MKQRTITALFILAVVIPVIYIGGIPFQILVTLVLVAGGYELFKVSRNRRWPWMLLILIISSMLAVAFLPARYMPVLISLYLLALFLVNILYSWFTIADLSFVFMSSILVSLAIHSALILTASYRMPLFFLVVGTYTTDTCAYLIGSRFGKHRLNPRISPKKSVEGLIGGYLFGLIATGLFAWFFMRDLYRPQLLIICTFAFPIVGQFGDLAFSSIKRFYGVKDFGSVFPAHGGVLDRIDSLIFNVIMIGMLMVMGV